MPEQLNAPTPDLLQRLTDIVGPAHALADPDQQLPYLREWRDLYIGKTPLVLRPGTTDEVSRIMALCHAARVAVVPQSGNTGLVGGQTPHEHGREIALSLARLNRVRSVDPVGGSLVVEAGVTLADAQAAAANVDRLFPLSLPSEGSCRIGGNLATNAGGVGVLAYGNTRALTLGVEAVLADGRIFNGLRALKKDNAGYDLRDLLIGSEGTLGIITAAVLKLFPRPAEQATAFVALPDIESALALLGAAQQSAGVRLTAFEFMPKLLLEMVLRNVAGARRPIAGDHPWYALIEISSARADGSAAEELQGILASALDRGLALDVTLATSLAQTRDLWKLRESVSEGQKPEGGNIKHDVSVPIASIPEFVRRADAIVEQICPGARPLPLGHFGDGNVHYNIAQPPGMAKQAFLDLWETISEAVHRLVVDLDGSIAAEHGVGRMKRGALARLKDPVELDMMRSIKGALDPAGILNPGKVL